MFVIRVNNTGKLVNSKPCNSCIYYMMLYGVKSVYYSNDKGEIIKEKLKEIEATHISLSQERYFQYVETNDRETLLKFNDNYRKKTRGK
jgi:deoxycytidylate deaminase